MKLPAISPEADFSRLYHGLHDPFNQYVTGDLWTIVTDTGAATILDAVGGVVALTTTNVDNDETYIHTKELFKMAAGKPAIWESLLQYTEIATDNANVLAGIMDAIAASAMQDNGLGPKASYSGACFFKADGDTVWSVENSVAGAQKTTKLDADGSLDGIAKVAGSAALYQRLGIVLQPISATLMDVMFFINGVLVCKHKDQVFTGFTEASLVFGVKAGDVAIETLNIDDVFAYQLR